MNWVTADALTLPLIPFVLAAGMLLITGYIFYSIILIFLNIRYKEELDTRQLSHANRLLFWYGTAVWFCAVLPYLGKWFFYGYKVGSNYAQMLLFSALFYMLSALLHTAATSAAMWSTELEVRRYIAKLRRRITINYIEGLIFWLSAWLIT